EVFRQLRNGGHAGRSDADYQALVKEVAARVAAAEQEAEDVGEDLGLKRAAAEGERRKLAGLARDTARRRAESLAEASREVARSVAAADAKRIGDVLAALGHDAPAEGAAAAKALAVEADRALQGFGQASATGRGLLNAVAGRGGLIAKRVYAAFALGFLGIGGLIWLKAAFPETFGAGEAALLGLIAAFGAVGAAVAQVHRFVDPVFRTANAFAEKLETAEATASAEEKTAREALARLEAEIAGIEARRQTLMADATRFRGAAPEQVLDFFLNESDATRAFDSGLGIVSRVRRAFEQLDAIFREAAAEGRRRPDAARFERIVLYIDDLDRCRAKQVVEVLEAAHLLLAFPLFVVVVGVDARWLEKSLLEYYKDKLDTGGDGDAALSGQATVHDFLEKIFQIPVRLRRLSTLPGDAYRSYIRAAAGPVSYGDAGGPSRDDGEASGGRTEIHPVDVEIKPAPPAAGAAAEQVRLTREEVGLFETLGPVVGKTPRAIKRFVNLYRLMRGMRRGLALDEFLGVGAPPGAARPYAAVQFWLAADVGLPETQATRLRRAIAAANAADSIEAIMFAAIVPPVPGSTDPPKIEPRPPYT
ncbi:MAG: P-loop NTPase fold protein, partial [Alphaproteobacteria bacterium]